MLHLLLFALLLPLQLYLLLNAAFLYYPMLGAILDRVFPRAVPRAPEIAPRFAVLVAAHNEEAVLGGALAALAHQRYPLERYAVHVVADNCTDGTAAIARAAGATVLERRTGGSSTKGQALAALWASLPRGGFDAVAVLDADNHADADFLSAMASELARFPAVQGLRRAKVQATATAGLDALTELCSHRVGAAGRRFFGVNGPLMGSGVAYAAPLFDRLISEVGETVVEDCEWQAKLALEGTPIHWTPRAFVFDEKTSHSGALQTQRNRWMAGRIQVARHFLPALMSSALGTGNRQALDMACFLLTPPRILSLAGFGLLALLAFAGLPGLLPAGVWLACLAGFAGYVFLGLALDGAPARSYLAVFRGTLLLPRFMVQMAAATLRAMSGAAVRWVPTPHGR